MIKINLLPFRSARKKENIRRQVSIFVGLVGLVLSAMAYYGFLWSREIATLEEKVNVVEAETDIHHVTIRKVKKYEKKLDVVKTKRGVIQKLELGRSGPVKIMDAMTQCVVRNRMWLKSMEDKEGALNIKGVAVDNATIAQFMKNLGKSKFFSDVNLNSSKQVEIDKNLKFKKFIISCKALNPDMPDISTQAAAKR